MNKEEKEAIKNAKEVLEFTTYLADIGHKDLEILLNLIQKQEKIIDLMARAIDNYDSQLVINTFENKEKVKEYFKKVVEENGDREKY